MVEIPDFFILWPEDYPKAKQILWGIFHPGCQAPLSFLFPIATARWFDE